MRLRIDVGQDIIYRVLCLRPVAPYIIQPNLEKIPPQATDWRLLRDLCIGSTDKIRSFGNYALP
ncbi:hypothetical protein BDV24DRAFT_121178 [Aspergillus arachidicola]|uniref:Uncharacterized protein n=1 Tax=Aspergillus arachidicola TaxID=656916 RepID=A0A5N6YVN5_9EURO|nr:hypothetical protein BDV24DRAFT_121178 [Aspergillus arachidicola]